MTTEQAENLFGTETTNRFGISPGLDPVRVVAKVLAMEPLVASRWMVRAALVGIR